jgi:hypothetical protein
MRSCWLSIGFGTVGHGLDIRLNLVADRYPKGLEEH